MYAGYTYTQPVGESTRFRGGLERVQVKRYLGEKCCGYACPKANASPCKQMVKSVKTLAKAGF
ncbi:hypothetical protein [Neisseria bergeri]|uniref:hypothetical protein n=1 Tax=Neisseria bergeri TaxID=1906581 RepID=UPI00142DE988|nr:hypothetical protein [Neisseria bergeri]